VIQHSMPIFRVKKAANIPLRESDCVISSMFLHPGVEYAICPVHLALLRMTGTVEVLGEISPTSKDDDDVLVVFPGGIGDMLSARPGLRALRNSGRRVFVASNLDDWELLEDVVDGFLPYPLPVEIMKGFSTWTVLDEHIRSDISLGNLRHRFAVALGVEPEGEVDSPDFSMFSDLAFQVLGGHDERKVGFHVRAANAQKSPPNQVWAWLAIRLASMGIHSYLIGTARQELDIRIKGKPAWPDKIHSLCGRVPSLRLQLAIINQLDILVGPDSAGIHLAAAAGTPSVGLFGPTDPKVIADYPNMTAMAGTADCAPCNSVIASDCLHPYCKAFDSLDLNVILAAIMSKVEGE